MTPLSSEEAFSWGPSAVTTAPSMLGCPLCVHPASQTHRRFLKEDLALCVPGTPISSTPARLHSRCLRSAKTHGPRSIVLSTLCTCRSIQEPPSVSASPVGGQDRPGLEQAWLSFEDRQAPAHTPAGPLSGWGTLVGQLRFLHLQNGQTLWAFWGQCAQQLDPTCEAYRPQHPALKGARSTVAEGPGHRPWWGHAFPTHLNLGG